MLEYKNILILDDDPTVRVSFEQQFLMYEDVIFKTYSAKNLQEAREIVADNHIDFAIVDLFLPDGKGEDFISIAPEVKVIILSSSEDAKRRENLFYMGIVDYFSKDNPLSYIFGEVVKNIIKYENNKGITIAIANESAIVRKFLKTTFENKNYTVLEAKDGFEVISLVNNFDISLLLLDMDMPKVDGMRVLYEMRSKKQLQELPVFIFSNITDNNKIASILKNGANEFIHKNFSVEHLLIKAENAIQAYIVHQELIHLKTSLQNLVEHKTNQLKELNENLEQQVRYRTMELQQAKDIIDKYVIISNTDKSGMITDVSEAFANTSGYTKNELIGKYHSIIKDPHTPYEKYKQIWQKLEQGEVWDGEFKNKTKDGKEYFIQSHIIPMKDINGEICGFMSVSNDITDKHIIQDQQVQLISQSRLATMGEMMSLITHQWKQPLSILSTSIRAIQLKKEIGNYSMELLDKDLLNFLKHLEYMNETIHTFGDFFAPHKLKHTIKISDIQKSLYNLIQKSLASFGITLHISYSTDFELYTIKNELIQVLINLISNSKDALISNKIEDAKIDINISQNDNKVYFEVIDNGGGMAQSVLDTLFVPYRTTKGANGTGLGLYMAKLIIQKSLDGDIVYENLNNCAKFTFWIAKEIQ